MIPPFAEQIEEHRNLLLNEVELSHEYWDDLNSERFHRYFYESNYKYNIDTFVDELILTLDEFERVEQEMRELENECGSSSSSSSSSSGGWFSSKQPYSIADNSYKQLEPNQKQSKAELFRQAAENLKKKMKDKEKVAFQGIKDEIYNDGDYDYIFKNGKLIGKRPNRQHYRE